MSREQRQNKTRESELKKCYDGLKHKGIWLLDASIVGINGMRQKNKNLIIRHCWDNYISSIISACKPEFLLCIGKGVWGALANDLRDIMRDGNVDWIPQPQARLSSMNPRWTSEEIEEKCFRIGKRF